jgi:hypothetical protein
MKKYFLITIIIAANLSVFSQRGFHLGASGAFNFNMIFPQHNYRTLLAPFAEPFVRSPPKWITRQPGEGMVVFV